MYFTNGANGAVQSVTLCLSYTLTCNEHFSFPASKQILLTHAASKKEQELYVKKKSTQGSQKSFRGRPGSAVVDTGQPILEEETMGVPTVEENTSTPQQVLMQPRGLLSWIAPKNQHKTKQPPP